MAKGDRARSWYRGVRPGKVAKRFMRLWAAVAGTGIANRYMVTLEVTGRISGRRIALPVMVIRRGDAPPHPIRGDRGHLTHGQHP